MVSIDATRGEEAIPHGARPSWDTCGTVGDMNRDQGLGVLILKKRITTFTLVMGMLIQTVSAMVVINTTLQTVLHDTEEEIAAVTAEESVIEAAEAALTGKG